MTAAPRHDARFVLWLSLAQLISWGSLFYTFALIMMPLERELGLSRAQTAAAFSLALLVEGLLAYPVGRWIDRGHERAVLSAGSLLAGLCLGAHSLVSSATGFYLVWAGLGAAMAAVLYTPGFAVLTRRFPGDYRRAIISMTFLGGLASTVFLPLTAWLMAALGWRAALACLASLHLLVCAPLHCWLLRDAPQPAAAALVEPAASRQADLRGHLLRPPFVLIGGFVVLLMAVTVALPTHMVSLLRENGLSELWVIAVPASIGLIQVLGRLLLYFFEHHVELHRSNRLIAGLIPLSLLALLAAPWFGAQSRTGLLLVWLFVLLYGMGNGMLTIVKGTAMAQYVSREHVASLNGALGLPLALARAAAPWLLGVLWQPSGGYALGLWLLLGCSLAGLAALVAAQKLAARAAVRAPQRP